MRKTLFTGLPGWFLVACGAGMGGIGQNSPLASVIETSACPELAGGAMSASFDANARANATIRAFVQAAGDFARVAAEAEAQVGAACQRMGADLGLAAEQMEPHGDQSRTAAACNAFAARMDAILAQGARGSIKAEVTPPKCTANASVEASCKGQCSAEVDPGYVKAHCQPGQLYGRCEATCSGSCSGTCNGNCQGQCAGSTASDGTCKGQCNGTCQGSCQGDCKGSCSVEFQEPKCAVAMKAPSADARCEGNCKADANLRAECTPASVRVESAISAGEMPKLVATLQANLPALIQAEVKYGARIADDIKILVQTGSELPSAFGQLSARAGSCIAAAANATLRAQASIRVSVEASASISAKAGARGQAG
jgi:modification target Cys-rich repeat protein